MNYEETRKRYLEFVKYLEYGSWIPIAEKSDSYYMLPDIDAICGSNYIKIKEKTMEEIKQEIEQKELFERCRHCGELITDENRSDLADDICTDCEHLFVKCEDCGEIIRDEDSYEVAGNRIVCEACKDSNYTYCECCETYVDNDNARHIEDTDEWICNNCYNDGDYFLCEECNNYFSGDVRRVDSDGCYYCENCYNKVSPIMDYSTKVEDVQEIKMFQKTTEDKKDLKLFYGIELEVLADDDLKDSVEHTKELLGTSNIICKRDGSLDDNGYEIVTAPMSYNRHHEFWRKFFEVSRDGKHYAKGLSSFNTDCCGIHIHVSRDALQLSDICKIVFFINEVSNTPFINFIASRSSNSYAQIKRKSLSDLQSIQKYGKLGYNDRYEAVNLANYNTIEIRIFKGTVEQTSFFKNLEFVDCLIKFVRNKTFLQLSYDEFLRFLGKYKDKYKNLYEWIMNKNNSYSNILKEVK